MLGKPVCSRFFILQPCSVVIGYHYERHVMPPDQTLRLLSTRYVRGKEAFPPWSLKDSQRAFDPFRMLVSSSSVRGSRAPLRLFLVRDRSSQVNEAVYRRRFAVHPCVSRFIIFVSLFFNVSSFFRRILEQKWREINRENDARDYTWYDWRNGNASWFEARLRFGSIDPAIGVYILARYIPSRPRQLCIINSALEPAALLRRVPKAVPKRTISSASPRPLGTLHANRALSFSPIFAKHLRSADRKDSFSTLQPLTENTTQLRGSIDGRSSSLIFECQTIFRDQRVAFMVDRIADWKLTNAEVKIAGFFFFPPLWSFVKEHVRCRNKIPGYRPSKI